MDDPEDDSSDVEITDTRDCIECREDLLSGWVVSTTQ
jgi:hypothetical protein